MTYSMNKFSKFVKHGKRLVAIMLVLFMNINSYAAIGANDGSAFVTKAEFDALVNTFNEQMDSYENTLGTKIDGAISNYLNSLSNEVTINLTPLINRLQESDTYKFKVWYDAGSATSGRALSWRGSVGGQYNLRQDGCAWTFSGSNNTQSETNNHVRLFKNDYKGYPVYIGQAYPYLSTIWALSGTTVITTYGAITFGTSSSGVRSHTRTAPDSNITTIGAVNYIRSDFSDSAWGTKYMRLAHEISWNQIKANVTDYYSLAADALSTSNTAFFRDEYRYTNDGVTTTTYNLSTNGSNILQWSNTTQQPTGAGQWRETSLPVWIVKTENRTWNSLYNYLLVSSGYGMKLYEGLPFFQTSIDGIATIKLNFGYGNDDTQYADFAISSEKFTNAVINSSNVNDKMLTVYPAYDPSVGGNVQTLTDVSVARVRCGDNVTVTMEVKKDTMYYIKLMPRASSTTSGAPSAGRYVYVKKDLDDIKIYHEDK